MGRKIKADTAAVAVDNETSPHDAINAQLCAALGIRDIDSLIEAVLELRPNEAPILIVRRHVVNPNEFSTVAKMLGLVTTTSTLSAINMVAH